MFNHFSKYWSKHCWSDEGLNSLLIFRISCQDYFRFFRQSFSFSFLSISQNWSQSLLDDDWTSVDIRFEDIFARFHHRVIVLDHRLAGLLQLRRRGGHGQRGRGVVVHRRSRRTSENVKKRSFWKMKKTCLKNEHLLSFRMIGENVGLFWKTYLNLVE